MMRKGSVLIALLLLSGCGGLRKGIIESMEDHPNANWMMVGEDLRPGDSAVYCLAEFRKHGGKKRDKHQGQCRKWTVTERTADTVTLQLEMENAPEAIQDIRRTYVVGTDGFIREARAFSTKTGETWTILLAGKGEPLSLQRLVPEEAFTAADVALVNAYSQRKDGRRYLTDAAAGPLEVVPVKAVFTPSEGEQRVEYYLRSGLAALGYAVQINVVRNLKKSKKDVQWVNELRDTAQTLTAPLP